MIAVSEELRRGTESSKGMEWPPGFQYWSNLLSETEEASLLPEIQALPFKPFEFRGYIGNRRVVSFGLRYDFNDSRVKPAPEIPAFLHSARDRAARLAGLDSSALQHALVTEYSPGAAIGWHKDRSLFSDVVGLSLASACVFRLRKKDGGKWHRVSIPLAPRSAYLLRGEVRTEWEHSIPAVKELRYSITFRNLKSSQAMAAVTAETREGYPVPS